MQDRPTAVELLQAMRDFCENELSGALDGRLRFQVRVMQNLLGILEREWTQEDPALRAEHDRLSSLLGSTGDAPPSLAALADAVKAMNVDLAAQIRDGRFDDRFDEAVEALYATTREKIAIANPNWVTTTQY